MKKITTLLLLCTVASSSALAQTKPVVNTGGEAYAKAYVASSYSRGGFLAQSGENLKHVSQSAYTYWFLQNGTAEGSVQLINVRTGKGISVNAADGSFNLAGTTADLYVLGHQYNSEGFSISKTKTVSTNSCIDARNDGDGCGVYDPRDNDWEGTTWVFHEAPGYFVSAAQGLVPVTTDQYHFDSKVITLPKATNKLRFRVLSTVTNNGDGANDPSALYPFFTMGEFYLYDADGKQVTLTADNFKTNAQETQSSSDKKNTVANLCDGSKATCFHSSYNTTPNTYHYIEVTLPTAMQSFKFSFDARDNKANVPAMIQIFDDEAIAAADVEDQVLALRSLYNSTNYSIGTDYQQYTDNGNTYTSARAAVNNLLQKYSGAVTNDEYNTAKANLENAAAQLTINTPADGSYIRIRSTNSAHSSMPYLTSDLSDVDKMTARAALVSGANNAANSIFYYKDKKLIAYGTGYKATLDNVSLGYKGIVEGTDVTFQAATEAKSEYNVVYNVSEGNSRKLYANVATVEKVNKYYTDAWNVTKNQARCRFWLEKVTSLPVSVSAAGYATLYAPVALTIPQNVQAYTASFADNNVTLTPIEGTIPANTGVVIEAAEGTYNFAITTTEATATSDLRGDVATAKVDDTSAAYILGKTDAQGVGFFKLNSTDRVIKGGRAYYVAPNGGAAAYLFNGNVTGLEAIKTALNDANAPIYDLSGRKVAKAVKGGLYIKNGQKFIVK